MSAKKSPHKAPQKDEQHDDVNALQMAFAEKEMLAIEIASLKEKLQKS